MPLTFAPARVEMDRRADGTIVLRSPQTLGPYARCVTEWLVHWAVAAPDRVTDDDGCGRRHAERHS